MKPLLNKGFGELGENQKKLEARLTGDICPPLFAAKIPLSLSYYMTRSNPFNG